MKQTSLLFGLFYFLFAFAAQAQTSRTDTLFIQLKDTVWLSMDNVVPFSEKIYVNESPLKRTQYQIDYYKGKLWFTDTLLNYLTAYVAYRSFSKENRLKKGVALRERQTYRADSLLKDSLFQKTDTSVLFIDRTDYDRKVKENIFEQQKLVSKGSLSRAVTVGTNTSVGVNSDFRLQLEGQLSNDIEIIASITDANIPIQPSGTTTQLNDFDKIFIQLKRDKLRLTFGDFEIQRQGTQFANLYRNVLGAQLSYKGEVHQWAINGSISKGKFHTNSFNGENGKQGPYRLRGRDNEQFFIVMAGSEKVYVNGKLMTRGEDRDYIIEYNTGEIRFTANRLITNNTRIVIDFEYAERNYSRSLIFGQYNAKALKDRLNIFISYGREADNPNAPIDFQMTDQERMVLKEAGDNPTLSFSSGVDSSAFNRSDIRYEKRDTVLYGKTYTYYLYSTDSLKAFYKLSFVFRGAKAGLYTRSLSTINGNVYTYVGVDSLGIPKGDYQPARFIPLPRLLHVFDAGAEFALDKKQRFKLYNETAVSIEDKNRLSNLDDKDNAAVAVKSGLRVVRLPLGNKWKFNSDFSFRFVGGRYTNIDRVYNVEYGREWNFNDTTNARQNEKVGDGVFEFVLKDKYRFRYNAGLRQMGTNVNSWKQTLELESGDSATVMGKNLTTFIVTTELERKSEWLRNNGDIYRPVWKIKPGIEIWAERKINTVADSMIVGSFAFTELKPYLRSFNSTKLNYDFSFAYRFDREFYADTMRNKSLTYTAYGQIIYNPVTHLTIQNTTTYNKFILNDAKFVETGVNSTETIMTNFQTNYNTKNRFIQTNVLYQILTEKVGRSQEIFVQVTPGMGQFVYQDFNGNGVQELNEFVLAANPLVANYIRLLVPTQNLYPVVSVTSGLTLRIDFQNVIKKSKNIFKQTLKNFISTTSLQFDQKNNAVNTQAQTYLINTREIAAADTNLLSALRSVRQEFSFFRNSAVGDFSFSITDNQSRQFLSSGVDVRLLRLYTARQRLNLKIDKSLENSVQYGRRSQNSQLVKSRNFDITYLSANPSFIFQFNRKLRLTSGYEFKWKTNFDNEADSVNSRLTSHKIILDAKFNYKNRNNIFAKIELFRIAQKGTPNQQANFEMLEGMQNGNNMIINVMWTQYLSKSLELSVVYDGRIMQNVPAIHTARMQLKAIF